ncbi:MAG: type IV-A pilus assembly ATPase PilB, partial [Panacagrimonas sp.]
MAINPQSPAPATPQVFLGGLTRRLVADKLITEEQARDMQAKAIRSGTPLVTILVEGKSVPALRLAEAASQEFGVPLLDLNAFVLEPASFGELNEKLLRKCHAVPLYKRGRRMFLGVS